MSTWTSDLPMRTALVAACLALAGCGGGFGFGGLGGDSEPAPLSTAVTDDRIVVAGPDGYCVDPTGTQDRGETGFVLLGNCAAISNTRRAIQPATPAVLTAAISAPSEGGQIAESITELDAFFRSDGGLELLSRSGDATTVTILDTVVDGDVFLLHANDQSETAIEGVRNEYWRAYLDLGSRIATLSVLALETQPLSDEESRATLQGFIGSVRRANAAAPDAPERFSDPVAPAPSDPETLPLDDRPIWNVGLFRRILG